MFSLQYTGGISKAQNLGQEAPLARRPHLLFQGVSGRAAGRSQDPRGTSGSHCSYKHAGGQGTSGRDVNLGHRDHAGGVGGGHCLGEKLGLGADKMCGQKVLMAEFLILGLGTKKFTSGVGAGALCYADTRSEKWPS